MTLVSSEVGPRTVMANVPNPKLESKIFEFYQIFSDFQWKSGILPYRFSLPTKTLVQRSNSFFKWQNLLCRCLFPYILFQNILLTVINVITDLRYEPIEHSLILQASWILIFVLITSILFIFQLNAVELVETLNAWIHLDYYIQGRTILIHIGSNKLFKLQRSTVDRRTHTYRFRILRGWL